MIRDYFNREIEMADILVCSNMRHRTASLNLAVVYQFEKKRNYSGEKYDQARVYYLKHTNVENVLARSTRALFYPGVTTIILPELLESLLDVVPRESGRYDVQPNRAKLQQILDIHHEVRASSIAKGLEHFANDPNTMTMDPEYLPVPPARG